MMSYRRRSQGSAITESGPALFLLLVIIFFPMIDFIEMGVAYIFASIHHDYMIRELAISFPGATSTDSAIQSGNQAVTKVNSQFQASSFYNFLKMGANDLSPTDVPGSAPDVTGPCIQYLPAVNPTVVQCSTECRVQPFISIPWWGTCPGLNAPFPIVITSQRPQEEKGRN